MSAAVPHLEAVEILRRIIDAPGEVRAVQDFDAATYGPLPFFIDQAEVTLTFNGGVVSDVASVRIGDRFSNRHGWDREADLNPWDALDDLQADMLELSLRSAAARL